MEKTYTGIDIGDHSIKIAVSNGVSIKNMIVESLPGGMIAEGRIVSFDAMTDLLKDIALRHKGLERNVAFSVPSGSCITRRMHVPIMTEKELELNLPFEFRDYITQGKDKYIYDYSVLEIEKGEEGKPESINLLAVASPKEVISDYTEMFRRAGFRLMRAMPPIACLQQLISKSEKALDNCCVIDFSHKSTQLHFFANRIYDVTRTIEIGGTDVTWAISSQFGIDEHMAGEYKHVDFNSANDIDGARQIYQSIAIEANRALNFYAFNNPDVALEAAYFCGGGSLIPALMTEVASRIDIPLASIDYVMPPYSGNMDYRVLCPLAVGAATR